MEEVLYEIEETKYNPRVKTTLDFKGSIENAEKKADEMARENIGTWYAVFRIGSYVAEYQAYTGLRLHAPSAARLFR